LKWRKSVAVRPDLDKPEPMPRTSVPERTRMPVHQIVDLLANGDYVEDLLADYPHLSREDIMASLDYAASLAEEQVAPIEGGLD